MKQQKFECEHCEKVMADVWYDEDTDMALCDKCIATKNEWLNVRKAKVTRFQALMAKRRQSVIQMWNLGLSVGFIAEQWQMKAREVRSIIRKAA